MTSTPSITATLTGPPNHSPEGLARGTQLGRYVVLDSVGAGGMGRVYAAYDPELDRRVALKVLHRKLGGDPTYLLHEARALARLQHANVLRVHDVGFDQDRAFVATEFLAGRNVATWAESEKRTWTAIVDVFLEIGKGLAAAHAEGLVHRDVKPSNMMVCDDGRVLLVDFGIAGEWADPEGGVLDHDPLVAGAGQTRLGDWLPKGAGTPGYMAPEQALGGDVGPAADQYSFALSLYRLLGGSTPLPPSGSGTQTSSPLPVLPGLPRNLLAILRRAMAEKPADRFPDLPTLLAALQATRSGGRKALRWGAVAAGLVLATSLGFWQVSQPDPCAAGAAELAAVWSPGRSDQLQSRLRDAATWGAVDAAIDNYGQTWQLQENAFCEEGRRGAVSPILIDLRKECLDQRLRELDATLQVALTREELSAAKIAEMVGNLVPVSTCSDTRALRAPAVPTLDDAGRRRLLELRKDQAAARALWTAGVHQEGQAAAASLVDAGRQLGHLPLVAEALLQRGYFEDALVDAQAAATLEEASLTAAACRHDRALAEALVRRVRVAGLHQEQFAEADRFAALARAALEALGRPALIEADLCDFEALIARRRGDYPRALLGHEKALELRRQELGEKPALAQSYLRLGNLLDDQNRQKEAKEILEKALSLQTIAFGENHPALADTLTRLGTIAREDGDLAGARRYHERALAIRSKYFGASRVPLAETRTYLGELAALEGNLELARQEFAGALAVVDAELGPNHTHRGVVLATMAGAFTEAGEDREALEPYHQAAAILGRALGEDHPQMGMLWLNLGAVHLRLGEWQPALSYYQKSVKVFAASLGQEDALYLTALTGVGDSLERLGRPREAIPVLEASRALDARVERGDKTRGDNAFALARALLGDLRAAGKQPARAESARIQGLLKEARDAYLDQAQASQRELAELTAWEQQNASGWTQPAAMAN